MKRQKKDRRKRKEFKKIESEGETDREEERQMTEIKMRGKVKIWKDQREGAQA